MNNSLTRAECETGEQQALCYLIIKVWISFPYKPRGEKLLLNISIER